ncbi:MAG: DUF5060 domain-containing protein, partial [Bacteroidota bacterium]
MQKLFPLLFLCLFFACEDPDPAASTDLTATKWQKVSLDFRGPATSETAEENPFTDYRLDVNFSLNDTVFTVPGFFAADGNAAETSADAGAVWRVNFRPDREGLWQWEAVFRKGKDIVYNDSQSQGERIEVEGQTGSLFVQPAAAGESGRLVRTHPRYLQWAESGEY